MLSSSPLVNLLGVFLFLFFVGSFYFSATETMIFSLSKLALARLRRKSPHGFQRVAYLIDRSNESLALILLGNNLANVGLALVAAILADHYIPHHPWLSLIFGAAAITIAILVIGEIVPKSLALAKAESLATWFSFPLFHLLKMLRPVVTLLLTLSKTVFVMLGIKIPAKSYLIDGEELKVLLSGIDTDVLEEEQKEMIEGVFEFGETSAEEIMTPRRFVEIYPATLGQEEMREQLSHSKFSRVLLCRENPDDIVGVLHAKDVLLNPDSDYRQLVRTPFFIPPKTPLMQLLTEFRKRRTHLAVVIDEFEGVAGIVTLQDLLEEIVGSLQETAAAASEPVLQEIASREYLVAGTIETWELNEELNINIPEELGRTLSGVIMNSLGRIPREGDRVTVDVASIEVRAMRGKGVKQALLRLASKANHD